jgi:Fur family ferric uptake transcriptional regulator
MNMSQIKQEYFKKIKENGHRLTGTRKIVIEILEKADKHMNADEIYFEAHKRLPKIGIATVYRNLKFLWKTGFVKKYDFGNGRSFYELNRNSDEKHHHHLICLICRKVFDYEDFFEENSDLFNNISLMISQKYNFEIHSHEVNFYGICKECREKRADKSH